MTEAERRQAMKELIDWCREERSEALSSIPKFESGEMQIGAIVNGRMIDGSAQHLTSLRRVVENMDALIATYERDYGQGT
jgi:hypothetical protein